MNRHVLMSAMGATALVAATLAGASSASALTGVASSAPAVATATAADDPIGTYYDAGPTRLLDTRKDGTRLPLAAGSTTTVQIAGRATANNLGIPETGVSAVVLNLTAVTTTSQGYFTVYPSDASRPTASSINFPKGWTGANMVTVPVGADGMVKIYNYGGAAHAVVDVLGWYAGDVSVLTGTGMGAQFYPATDSGDATRLYDSRQDPDGAYAGGDYIEFSDEWVDEATAASIRAYTLNITAVGATKPGVLTAWAGGGAPKPATSTLNYEPGVIAPNMAVVPAGQYGGAVTGFRIQNASSGTVNFVVDIAGYYVRDDSAGLRYTPLAPHRILDTRKGIGLSGAFTSGQVRTLDASSVSSTSSSYVVANTTGVVPSKQTYLTVWSGDGPRPTASNLNVAPGLVRSVSTYAPLSASGSSFTVYNNAGTMDVVIDAAGTLDLYTPTDPLATSQDTGATTLQRSTGTSGEPTGTLPAHPAPRASASERG
ncbi:MAG TPA: hypothetical protein VFN34_11555 [Ornithinibacter sp.]|nr:hypothetical protein [Ornithinibacter sp.]